MQLTTSIHHIQHIATSAKNAIVKRLNKIRATLSNETTQKIVLFVIILAVLLVAANLNAIL